MIKAMLIAGGLFCGTAVMLGAFAAHGLKKMITPQMLAVFETGVQYQFYHGIALMIFALVAMRGVTLKWTGLFAMMGVLLFSGSLYLLALTSIKWVGFITPIGGLCMVTCWVLFIKQVAKFNFE